MSKKTHQIQAVMKEKSKSRIFLYFSHRNCACIMEDTVLGLRKQFGSIPDKSSKEQLGVVSIHLGRSGIAREYHCLLGLQVCLPLDLP